MPILEINSHVAPPNSKLLDDLCSNISMILSIPDNLIWIRWNCIKSGEFYYKGFDPSISSPRHIVFINCKEVYSKDQISEMMKTIANSLSILLGCSIDSIFIAVRRVRIMELMVNGKIWEGAN